MSAVDQFTRHRIVRRILPAAAAGVGLVTVPTTAQAETSTFHRLEANAVAIYRNVARECDDGSTAQLGFRVTGGHEEESEDAIVTEDHDFLTVFVNGTECGGNFVNATGTGDAAFTWSPSLQRATVYGTVDAGGRSITVELSWAASGPLAVDTNTSTHSGFTGIFVGRSRDAVATGTIVIDGGQFVNGSTADAGIETLEDTNIRRPS